MICSGFGAKRQGITGATELPEEIHRYAQDFGRRLPLCSRLLNASKKK